MTEEKDIEFKNYKEKQKYYKNKTKNFKWFWISKDIIDKKGTVIKGRTHYKPEGGK